MLKYEWCVAIKDCLSGSSYDDPMPVRDISEIIGMHESNNSCPRVRKLIKDTMKYFNLPIGADYRGFYIIRTAHEMQRYLNSLLKRQIGITDTIDICYEAFHGRFNLLP